MNFKRDPAVVCLSGGMDSTSLLLKLLAEGREVHGLSFDYGQKHRFELECLQANLDYLRTQGLSISWNLIDISDIATLLHSSLIDPQWQIPTGHYESDSMKQTVVPNRNAIFASITFASALSLSQRLQHGVAVCLGVHAGDHAIYPDCKPEFFSAIFDAFSIGNWDAGRVSLDLPYVHWNKCQILQDAQNSVRKLQLDFNTVFRNTCTSYEPDADGRSSGSTGSDIERILAFHKLGLVDPITYVEPWSQVVERAIQIEDKFRKDEETNQHRQSVN